MPIEYSFKLLLVISLFVTAVSGSALADTKQKSNSYENPYGYHICGDEKAAVTKACKKGDPCGKACQAAEKKFKKCSIANNLPQHQAWGNLQKPDCTKPEDLPGAAVDPTPSMGNPVNPLQSNHF